MTTKSEIILRGPENWSEWNREFMSSAIAMELWDYIKENPKALLTEPVKPEPNAYKKPGALSATAASSSSTIDLTQEELQNFQIAWSIYTANYKAYERQRKQIQDLKSWVRCNIAQQYKSSSCAPDESLHQWYTKLKEHASMSKTRETQMVRDLYRAANEPLAKPPRNWNSWILTWEEAMSKAEEVGLSEAKDAAVWFDDFIQAIELVASSWALSYRMIKEAEIEKGTLTYRMVANDLREQTRPRALGSTPSSQSMRDASASQQTPGRTGKKREWNSTSEGDEYCLACERFGHQLEDCFYIFPAKAFDGFKPRKSIQQRVDKNRKKEEVIAELGRLKKLRRED